MFIGSLMHYLHARDCLGFSESHYLKKVVGAVLNHLRLSVSV